MSFNATRLTCFALISAIETDCREAILGLDESSSVSLPEQAVSSAAARLPRGSESGMDDLDVLIQYFDFADSYQILLQNKTNLPNRLRDSVGAVASHLEEMIAVRNRVAHSRPMEVNDLPLTNDLARELVHIDPHSWSTTRETLNRLNREPAFVLGLTVELPSDPLSEPQHNLPIPDFDETGFFGRTTESRRIRKALLGPYPVVSVIGDGGIGKTAIALKIAYDLLDASDSPFEAIVWVSAKATTLTLNEVKNISGAIQDSLGLFEAAAAELGTPRGSDYDPVRDVLEYLEEFKILLILDNLETVTDQRLRNFLLDLPIGSKVLLTSRIGLGSIENPVKLDPLSNEESKKLLRSLAGNRNIQSLRELDDEGLRKITDRLQGHPLYIKWLVSGVQAGRRPEELVGDNSLLLDFCMSNVYDKLSETAAQILQSLQISRGARTVGELAFINSLASHEIQPAILELMTTNFVTMRYSADVNLDSVFETGDFASQYLSRHQVPTTEFRSKITRSVRQLSDIGHGLMADSRRSPYDAFTIDVRGQPDVPAARLLRSALSEARVGNYDLALDYCGEAQGLSPSYPEAWRVEGLIHFYRDDMASANSAYERAFEHAAGASTTSFHYANFVAEGLHDNERALSILQDAVRNDHKNIHLLQGIAAAHFDLGNVRETIAICGVILDFTQSDSVQENSAIMALRSVVFGAESQLWDGNLANCVEYLEDGNAFIQNNGVGNLDLPAADWIIHLKDISSRASSSSSHDSYLKKRANEFEGFYTNTVRTIDSTLLSRQTGMVKNADASKRFAFIQSGDVDYFLHRNDLLDRDAWSAVERDVLVAFDPDTTGHRGPRASHARPLA